MTSFNDFIAEVELREVHQAGARFTWSNNQELPIRVVLDRVLISGECESLFPLLGIQAITRLGSDHNALLLDSGETENIRSRVFRFEPSWLLQEGFRCWLSEKWL